MDADVIIVGAGLAGLVAARETAAAGLRTIIVDQEGPQDFGGQAWWSFGGLFMVDTPEQRRFGVRDSFDLAWQDWQGSAQWDRQVGTASGPGEDTWAERWGAPMSSSRPVKSIPGSGNPASTSHRSWVGLNAGT